ncbi:structural protein [Arsenophonus nasoniae]|uniref:Structural protein n=1 Tax=Arsenophonus nasoniae TaxID=638 RepID=A0AA95K7F3_9GAMM|nr:structural protein [Arsenophonus nasoniae]WGL95313.1 structural protein [Arsenophonus nasoniae]
MADIPRGIRNHNPGNIDYNPANQWRGLLPHDPTIEKRFCRFISPEYGIRAIMVLLKTYYHQYGLHTIAQLIGRWAPDNENNTTAYCQQVAARLGVSAQATINVDDKNILINLTKAIIQHENGQQPYHDAIFISAVNRL